MATHSQPASQRRSGRAVAGAAERSTHHTRGRGGGTWLHGAGRKKDLEENQNLKLRIKINPLCPLCTEILHNQFSLLYLSFSINSASRIACCFAVSFPCSCIAFFSLIRLCSAFSLLFRYDGRGGVFRSVYGLLAGFLLHSLRTLHSFGVVLLLCVVVCPRQESNLRQIA